MHELKASVLGANPYPTQMDCSGEASPLGASAEHAARAALRKIADKAISDGPRAVTALARRKLFGDRGGRERPSCIILGLDGPLIPMLPLGRTGASI